MAIEEKDRASTSDFLVTSEKTDSLQQQQFLTQFRQTSDRNLAHPVNPPNWRLLLPLIVCTVLAIIFFANIINLGKTTLNWKIGFDVNLVATLLLVIVGALTIGPKIAKDRMALRNQNTIASLLLLVLVVLFFFLRVIELGNFDYTLDKIDTSSLIGLLLIIGIMVLAWLGSVLALITLAAFFLWWGFSIRSFGFQTITDLFTSENGGRLLRALTPPKWDYFSRVIDPMLLTVQTAVSATVIGVIVALPLSILAARNTSPHPIIYNLVRFLINTVRAIPSLILALLLIPFVGLGPAAGVLGLGIHSISVLTKLYAEAFESVKPQPLEALNAVGANGFKTFRWGVFPQAFPLVASYSIFNWESNGRDSTVVAFVGGGGIGFLLQQNLSLLNYANVAVLLIVLILTVAILDRFSDFVRSKII